ncbi:hypothetical protein INR49_005535 [Caranx melampygus]|nr:hypothetical protein INR49_005535 [Caranx melampygus]
MSPESQLETRKEVRKYHRSTGSSSTTPSLTSTEPGILHLQGLRFPKLEKEEKPSSSRSFQTMVFLPERLVCRTEEDGGSARLSAQLQRRTDSLSHGLQTPGPVVKKRSVLVLELLELLQPPE